MHSLFLWSEKNTRTQTYTRTGTRTRTHTHARTKARARAHAHEHARTRRHRRTHAHTHKDIDSTFLLETRCTCRIFLRTRPCFDSYWSMTADSCEDLSTTRSWTESRRPSPILLRAKGPYSCGGNLKTIYLYFLETVCTTWTAASMRGNENMGTLPRIDAAYRPMGHSLRLPQIITARTVTS